MKTASAPWVLGISNSHNGAVCLLHGDRIVAAIQEERLTRVKRRRIIGSAPSLSIRYCLEHAGITPRDLDLIVYTVQGRAAAPTSDVNLNPQLQPALNGVPVLSISHHYAHAVSTFAVSGFQSAATLVVDGVGSPLEDLSPAERAAVLQPRDNGWETTSLYRAHGVEITPLEKHLVEKDGWLQLRGLGMPTFGSLGGIFSAASWQIFGDVHEAGKVMGLAPYGQPDIPAEDFFEIENGRFVFKDVVPRRFAFLDRWPARREQYQNLSASCQRALEVALMYLVARLREQTGEANLCYAGGVALNSIANERIQRESGFQKVFIVPAAEDSGCAIGAAYHGLWQLTGTNTCRRLVHDAVGRTYSKEDISKAVEAVSGIEVTPVDDVVEGAVDLLCDGKILGWFQGGSELGPRALGQRSILCDPRGPDVKAVLNGRVKHREAFRPFAPVILLEETANWFDLEGHAPDSPFMLRICRFREEKQEPIPAVVHVDGTGRLQTVTAENNGLFYRLVRAFFERTGVPIILNTSFNVMDEPIVESPEDALLCMVSTGIDAVVFEDRIVSKQKAFSSVLDLFPSVACTRWASANLVRSGRLALNGNNSGSYVWFSVDTPWGRTRQLAGAVVLRVLELLDGKRNGWMLLDELRESAPIEIDERELAQTLELWRITSMGEGLLDGSATVNDVIDTLHRQRRLVFDESGLTKLLVRLRRQSVIRFSAQPQT